jgi:hypothetical protein
MGLTQHAHDLLSAFWFALYGGMLAATVTLMILIWMFDD